MKFFTNYLDNYLKIDKGSSTAPIKIEDEKEITQPMRKIEVVVDDADRTPVVESAQRIPSPFMQNEPKKISVSEDDFYFEKPKVNEVSEKDFGFEESKKEKQRWTVKEEDIFPPVSHAESVAKEAIKEESLAPDEMVPQKEIQPVQEAEVKAVVSDKDFDKILVEYIDEIWDFVSDIAEKFQAGTLFDESELEKSAVDDVYAKIAIIFATWDALLKKSDDDDQRTYELLGEFHACKKSLDELLVDIEKKKIEKKANGEETEKEHAEKMLLEKFEQAIAKIDVVSSAVFQAEYASSVVIPIERDYRKTIEGYKKRITDHIFDATDAHSPAEKDAWEKFMGIVNEILNDNSGFKMIVEEGDGWEKTFIIDKEKFEKGKAERVLLEKFEKLIGKMPEISLEDFEKYYAPTATKVRDYDFREKFAGFAAAMKSFIFDADDAHTPQEREKWEDLKNLLDEIVDDDSGEKHFVVVDTADGKKTYLVKSIEVKANETSKTQRQRAYRELFLQAKSILAKIFGSNEEAILFARKIVENLATDGAEGQEIFSKILSMKPLGKERVKLSAEDKELLAVAVKKCLSLEAGNLKIQPAKKKGKGKKNAPVGTENKLDDDEAPEATSETETQTETGSQSDIETGPSSEQQESVKAVFAKLPEGITDAFRTYAGIIYRNGKKGSSDRDGIAAAVTQELSAKMKERSNHLFEKYGFTQEDGEIFLEKIIAETLKEK